MSALEKRAALDRYLERVRAARERSDLAGDERRRALGIIHPLSRREQEILALIAQGFSNDEVGLELHITLETVKSHVQSILAKLGARNRAHAVALGYESRMLTPAHGGMVCATA